MSAEYENMQVEKWVNLEDVAEHLSLSQDTVRTWIKEGKLPVYKAGKRYKFKISEVDEWGKRKLAYLINKEAEGYYVLINFESNAEFPAELDRIYKITDGVLRSMIIKKED